MTGHAPHRRTRSWIAAVAWLACGIPAACAPGVGSVRAEPQTLRVMTYNIFAGNDLERRSSLERVGALIDSLRPDVVFLQEVDRATARSGNVDQASVIAERANMQAVYGAAMEFDGGHYGLAVLSRLPVLEAHTFPLDAARPQDHPGRYYEPRVLMHVVVSAPGGVLHVLNTHLDHQADSPFRQPQMLQVIAHLATVLARREPVVLGGDLNARPETVEVRALTAALEDAWPACGAGPGYTFRSDRLDRRIDYVLFARLRCVAAAVLDTTLSDHQPVVVDFVIGS